LPAITHAAVVEVDSKGVAVLEADETLLRKRGGEEDTPALTEVERSQTTDEAKTDEAKTDEAKTEEASDKHETTKTELGSASQKLQDKAAAKGEEKRDEHSEGINADEHEEDILKEQQELLLRQQYNQQLMMEVMLTQVPRILIQMVFGLVYYIVIVSKYPSYKDLPEPNQAAKDLQKIDEVSATCRTSCENCLLSWCCSGPRAAHTFYSTLGLNYVFCCLVTSCFPCCALWYVNSCTDLNEKLGGERRNLFVGAICACLCSCCVIAQDAESLDLVNGVKTGFCGISADPRQDVAQGNPVTQ